MSQLNRRSLTASLSTLALVAVCGLAMAQQPTNQVRQATPANVKQLSPEEAAKMKEMMAAKQQPTPVAGQALPNALNIENPSFDWGDISDAEPVSHTFNFTNVSDRTIKIAIAASCGCTVAGLEKDTYAPGEAGKATATFNPQGRNGSQTKQLTMTVVDPQGVFAQQTMTLTSNVKALVTTEPPKMYLSEVDHKAGQTSKVVITGRSPDFRITTATANNEFIKTKIGEPTPLEVNGEKMTKYEVELEVGKGAPIGNLNGQITFETNDPKLKVPPYFLGADVIGEIKATPPQAMLRVTNVSTPFETQVRVDSRSGSPFHITSLDIEGRQDMQLVADAVQNEEAGYYMVTISGVTPEQPGIVNGTIVVVTDAQGGETIRIPFTAAVRKADASAPTVRPLGMPTAATGAAPAIIKK